MDNGRRQIELMNSLFLDAGHPRRSTTATKSAWVTTSTSATATACAPLCNGPAIANAGFSRADPARLYFPVIMDPVYGYQAVNVEAQQRTPTSLLNWMRMMINVRRRYRALGRGALRFLYPENQKVLAYLRESDGEVILCVANLSRFVQAARSTSASSMATRRSS
jgi:maltose alpha-D-glucosyltransferase/alpha-amylase